MMLVSLVLMYAFLASTYIIGKIALVYGKPLFLIAFRMIIAGAILLGYSTRFSFKRFRIARSDVITFILVSLYHVFITFNLEFWALQYLDAAKTTLLYSATPFIAALLAFVIEKTRLRRIQVVALVIGFIGLLPILALDGMSGNFRPLFTIQLPELAVIVSMLSACYAWFLVKHLMRKGYGLSFINGFAMLVGGLMSLGSSWFVEGMRPPVTHMWPFIAWALLLVMIGNILVYSMYGWLLQTYSITFVSFVGFLCPIFGSLFGWLFLGEHITWHYFASLSAVTLGLFLYYREELKVS